MYFEYYVDKIRGLSFVYDLVDLQFDNPRLFSNIINETLEAERMAVEEREQNERKQTLSELNRLIIEVSNELLGPSKFKILDTELNRIKTEFYWQGIKTDEKVETIFWQDCYDGFVSFMRQNGKPKMIDIFDLDIEEIKNAGFSTQYISEIISIFTKWSERLLTTEVDIGEKTDDSDFEEDRAEIEADEENATEPETDTVGDLLSMFFRFEKHEE